MKKALLLFAVIFCSFSVLYAGGGGGGGKTQKDEVLVLTLGTQDNPGTVTAEGLERAKEYLMEVSNGKMTLEIFYSSQLGDYKAMTGQATAGELDMFQSGFDNMSFLIPEFGVFGYPYVVSDYDHLMRALESEFVNGLLAQLSDEQNIQLVDIWNVGQRHTTANRPLDTIDDFKGLKLRTPNVATTLDYAQAVGAVASPVAFAEVYLALQTNQVEAQENPLTTIDSMKFYEVQKFLALTGHILSSNASWINVKKYETLSDQQKAWLRDAFLEGRKACNGKVATEEAHLIEKFEAEGMTVSNPDLDTFKAAMIPFYDKLEETLNLKGIIAKIQSM